jgi:hypothetical protein
VPELKVNRFFTFLSNLVPNLEDVTKIPDAWVSAECNVLVVKKINVSRR